MPPAIQDPSANTKRAHGTCRLARRVGGKRRERLPSRVTPVILAAMPLILVLLAMPPASHAERSHRLSLTMDHVLVRADFIGEIQVLDTTAVDGLYSVRTRVVDQWFSRWPYAGRMTFRVTPNFPAIPHLVRGSTAIVFLSGGAWQQSPFTHRENSVFPVTSDGRVICHSSNPLFAVTDAGFHCSIPELTAGSPLTVVDMRASALDVRARSVRRLPELAALLDGLARPLQLAPSVPLPSAPESEVVR